jgi:hypothetical protein
VGESEAVPASVRVGPARSEEDAEVRLIDLDAAPASAAAQAVGTKTFFFHPLIHKRLGYAEFFGYLDRRQ